MQRPGSLRLLRGNDLMRAERFARGHRDRRGSAERSSRPAALDGRTAADAAHSARPTTAEGLGLSQSICEQLSRVRAAASRHAAFAARQGLYHGMRCISGQHPRVASRRWRSSSRQPFFRRHTLPVRLPPRRRRSATPRHAPTPLSTPDTTCRRRRHRRSPRRQLRKSRPRRRRRSRRRNLRRSQRQRPRRRRLRRRQSPRQRGLRRIARSRSARTCRE